MFIIEKNLNENKKRKVSNLVTFIKFFQTNKVHYIMKMPNNPIIHEGKNPCTNSSEETQ